MCTAMYRYVVAIHFMLILITEERTVVLQPVAVEEPKDCRSWEDWQCSEQSLQSHSDFPISCAKDALGYYSCPEECERNRALSSCADYCEEYLRKCKPKDRNETTTSKVPEQTVSLTTSKVPGQTVSLMTEDDSVRANISIGEIIIIVLVSTVLVIVLVVVALQLCRSKTFRSDSSVETGNRPRSRDSKSYTSAHYGQVNEGTVSLIAPNGRTDERSDPGDEGDHNNFKKVRQNTNADLASKWNMSKFIARITKQLAKQSSGQCNTSVNTSNERNSQKNGECKVIGRMSLNEIDVDSVKEGKLTDEAVEGYVHDVVDKFTSFPGITLSIGVINFQETADVGARCFSQKKKEILFILRFNGSGNDIHFYLLIAEMEAKLVHVCDSSKSGLHDLRREKELLLKPPQDKEMNGEPFFKDFEVVANIITTEKQADGESCGLYVIRYVESYLNKVKSGDYKVGEGQCSLEMDRSIDSVLSGYRTTLQKRLN